ncbi:hypothetical protein ACGFNU_00240 [Spirillospora sp. NPDC048911]|uniref:hypothetical protein n=1 Tax=Spirillospora sp. NPDC048911 TaxID=3364527 RepID=UPI003719C23C
MASFSYIPRFHHPAFHDHIDLVTADGSGGFNIRFDTIESDLKALTPLINDMGTAIDALNARVPPLPPTATQSFTPTLQPLGTGTPWILQSSGNAVAPTTGGPSGVLILNLPDRVRMTSIRIRGKGTPPPGQNAAFFLIRTSVADGTTQTVVQFDTGTVPFGTAQALPNTAISVVDLANFRYSFTANSGATPANSTDPVTLFSAQITYNNP